MASLTRSQLKTASNSTYDTNGVGGITAAEARTFNNDLIDSLITNDLTSSMVVLSASFATSASSVNGQTLTSLNQFTASQDTKNLTLASYTGSNDTTNTTQNNRLSNLESKSASVDISITNINQFTASNGNTSLNQFTSSANNRLNNLESTSASVNVSITNLNSTTASQAISISNLNAATSSYAISSSVAAVDAAQQSQINSLIASTGSYITSSVSIPLTSLNAFTQSQYVSNSFFATTGSNGFKGNQSITGSLVVDGGAYGDNRLSIPIGTSPITFTVDAPIQVAGTFGGSGVGFSFNGSNPRLLFRDSATTYETQIYNSANDFYVAQSNGKFISFPNISTPTTIIYNKLDVSGSVAITGSLTASLQQGYAWVGNSNGVSVAVATSSFAGGASTDITALNQFTASQDTKNSTLANVTASLQSQLTNIGSQSGSWVTETESGSFLITASVNLNTITFTKGNNTTFAITVNTGSAATTDITSLNAFTASQDTKNSTLATYTASVDQKFSNIGSQSGSWITESETASFARTNVDNNFTANQTFTNITAVSASFQYVQTTYETSSVIYSSGSNQFGDELTDIQTLSGSVKVQGSLTVNGIPVQTSSVDITSLNQFTASQETKNSTLASYTQSVDSSLTNINSFTASNGNTSLNSYTSSNDTKWSNLAGQTGSYVTSAITASSLVTASFDNGTRNLTFTKGNTTQFSVNIPDASGSAAATTTIYDTVHTGESITKGDPLYISGSQGANPIVYKADAAIAAKMPVTYVSNETIGAGTTTEAIILGHIEGINLTGYTAGQAIYVAEGGGWSASLPSGSNSVTQLLGVITKGGSGGKGLVLNPGPAQLPGLDTGKMWVGNGNNQPTEITTASFASSASFNSYTSSTNSRLNNIEAATSSYVTSAITASSLVTASFSGNTLTFTKGDASTFGVVIPDVSGSTINTGSFATTGSNAFVGNQTINGASFGTGATTGTASIAIGLSTLSNNTGQYNVAIGQGASQANTSGYQNVAVGLDALQNNQNGSSNIGIGGGTFRDNISGSNNTFVGGGAGINASSVNYNVGIGSNSLSKIQSNENTAVGANTLLNTTTGNAHAAFGYDTLKQNTTGAQNSGFGYAALQNNTTGDSNTGLGAAAGRDNQTGAENVFIGWVAGYNSGNASNNVIIGARAGQLVKSGLNTIIGWNAGANINSGSGNTFIGKSAGANVSGSNNTFIGGANGVGNENGVIALSDGEANIRAIYNSGWVFTGSVDIQNTLTASLQQGYVWVGDASGRTTTVATSSFGGGGTTDISSLNAFTQSIIGTNPWTASIDQKFATIGGQSGSWGGGGTINTGSFATTGSNVFTGDQTFIDAGGNFFTISDTSGSMMLVAKTFTSASAHLTASVGGKVNIIFKDNNNTADTIISGSNNIFVNPAAPTAGFKRYVGGSNNIYNSTGLPQISSSMAYPVTMNTNIGPGAVTMRGPVSSSTWTMASNYIAGTVNIGSTAGNNAEKIVSGLTLSTNNIQGTLNVIANQVNLTSSVNISTNTIGGTATLNANSSSATFTNNIVADSAFTWTNNYYTNSVGQGAMSTNRNLIIGQSNTMLATGIGDVGIGAIQPTLNNNILGGTSNTLFINATGASQNNQLISSIIYGNTLIVTGSSNPNTVATLSSAFFGRFNANDGVRNSSAGTIFAVGTGTASGTRKTGFLIDSGSNAFVEGTLSVSGATTINGNTTVTGSLNVSASAGLISRISSSIGIRGNFTFTDVNGGQTNIILGNNAMGSATGSTLSVAIGDGSMRFTSGSQQNVAIGYDTLRSTIGTENVAIASNAMYSNTTGGQNVAIGIGALNQNTTGFRNMAIGGGALFNNTAGDDNVAVGNNAGNETSGSLNTFIGGKAGQYVSGSRNVIIGAYQGTAGMVLNNNIILSDGAGNIKAQYSGSAWAFQDNIKFNKGTNKTTDIVSVNGSATVTNSLVTGGSVILLTTQNGDVAGTMYPAVVMNKGTGTFDIVHDYGGTLDVAYLIINPT